MASGGPSWLCGRAQLGWWRYCPKLGPPGSQLVHRHCPHLAGSEEQMCPWGELVASSCFAASVGPGQFKRLLCYLNPSSLVTTSSLSRGGVCATGFSSLPLWGVSRPTDGWGQVLHCSLLHQADPVPSVGLCYA